MAGTGNARIRSMNEREEFLQNFRSAFIKMVERLDTMTESQVLDGILLVKASRNIYKEELSEQVGAMNQARLRERPQVPWATRETREALADPGSMHAFSFSVHKLRSRAGAKAPLGTHNPFNALEAALKERLESLRERPSGNA